MCDCRSYNRPEWGGSLDEVVIDPRLYFSDATKTVCVDSCLAHVVTELWRVGIKTAHSCCGHNNMMPSIGLMKVDDVAFAAGVIARSDPRKFRLFVDTQ